MSSRALEVNLATTRVDVRIDPKYDPIRKVMSGFFGLQDGLSTFLTELCHPYKNWQFIVAETRTYSLGYFHAFKSRPEGPEVVRLYTDIALDAMSSARDTETKTDAFKNLFLLWQRIVREGSEEIERFLPVLEDGFNRVNELPAERFRLVVASYYQLTELAQELLRAIPPETKVPALGALMARYFDFTYSYWLSENDPLEWFSHDIQGGLSPGTAAFFEPIVHSRLESYRERLNAVLSKAQDGSATSLRSWVSLPGYGDIVAVYEGIPGKLAEAEPDEKKQFRHRLIFLFHTLNVPGLAGIHEDSIRQINRAITWLIRNEDHEHIKALIVETTDILRKSVDRFPGTVLTCVLNMGKGVYRTDNAELVRFFNQSVVRLGFQTPDFQGISGDWQLQSNIAHIQNIRTWMELISLNPKWSQKLLSSLIINLTLHGVLIKDTDLFPRDITAFLNTDIAPVYNLVKQLMRLFPAYFNEIGAEGQLRDISTRLDEACRRKDILIHFLRKQSHVESSSEIIAIIEAVLTFWLTKSKDGLRLYVPESVFEQIQTAGDHIDGVHHVIGLIFRQNGCTRVQDLLALDEDYLARVAPEFPPESRLDMERVALALSFYRLLNQKYCIYSCDINEYLAQVQSSFQPPLGDLEEIMGREDRLARLKGILKVLGALKSTILSSESFEIREDIYRKRHFATDIPSMYGTYHESKFDALGLTFRLEAIANALFEDLIKDFDLSFVTRATFEEIVGYLKLFRDALELDGFSTKEFERHLDLLDSALKIRLFTFTQYVDIFRGLSRVVRNIVSDYFNGVHKYELEEITGRLSPEKLLPKYRLPSESSEELTHKISEVFLRDGIALSLGLQRLDLFLTHILNTLYKQADQLPVDRHYLLLTYNPENVLADIADPRDAIKDLVHLGNKGFNIVRMKKLGLRVPPGFVISTEVFRCRELLDSFPPADLDFRERVRGRIRTLEHQTGTRFGDPAKPLLVSVRSGAAVSLPGMMDSYLNVGINTDVVKGIADRTGNPWFAWDCYRRFLQSYGMSFGMERDEFDALIQEGKDRAGVLYKKDLTADDMKRVTIKYRDLIRTRGITLEDSPDEQLFVAIRRVLKSWDSPRARTFRRIIGISDDWGTSVTVQSMVFGNLSQQAGAGVVFTHSPRFSPDLIRLWGDYSPGNQGEDVVAGLVATYPISNLQARIENRSPNDTLENRFPAVYGGLGDVARLFVEENGWSPQDIEFTFEGPEKETLYILQTRDMETRERAEVPSFVTTPDLSERLLGHGVGVSGGALSGRVVFTLEEISHWRRTEPETPLILIRGDIVPDDIKEISAADGLLTARGGATSHAAIVATRLGKTCVAGCTDLLCLERECRFTLNGVSLGSGDLLSIDGAEGSIYRGAITTSAARRS